MEDPMASLAWPHLLILVAVLLVMVLIVILAFRGWRRRGVDAVIGVTLTVAALVAVFAAFGVVVTVIAGFQTGLTITIPVQQFWPHPASGVSIQSGPSAHVDDGGFTTAEVTASGLSTGIRVMWVTGQAIGVLLIASVAALVAVLCFQLLRGAPFVATLRRAALVTAVVCLVGGLGSQLLCGIAGGLASYELLEVHGWACPRGVVDACATGLPTPFFSLDVNFWPIGAALGLAVFAALLRVGSRLQRDTEGLV
jgi:hypothetical protein